MLADKIRQAAEEFRVTVASAYSDGSITFLEAYALAQLFAKHAISVASSLGELDEDLVKSELLQAFDAYAWPIIGPLDLPGPDMILDPILHYALQRALLVTVDYAIDGDLDAPIFGLASASDAAPRLFGKLATPTKERNRILVVREKLANRLAERRAA